MLLSKNIISTLQWVIDNQEISKNTPTKKYWYHFPKTNPESYCDNINNLAKIKNWSWTERVINIFQQRKEDRVLKSEGELVLLKSLNGVLLFNISKKYVAKLIDKRYEPDYLNNEITAFKSLPNNVPQIIDCGKKENYFYVLSELVSGNKKYNWKNWSLALKKITPLVGKLYTSNPILQYDSEFYVEDVKDTLNKIARNKQFLNNELAESSYLIKLCLEKYHLKGGKICKVFAHGDLVPNNVRVKNNKVYILDWANGGMQNYIYDLFIQNFYFTSKPIWRNFDNIDFLSNEQVSYFFGWTKDFLGVFNKKFRKYISNEQIRLSIVLSLAEKIIKTFSRYQSSQEYLEGKRVFDNAIKICNLIVKQ